MNLQRITMSAKLLFAVTLIISAFMVEALGQPKVGGAGGSVVKDPPSGGATKPTPTRTTKAPVKTVVRTEVKLVTPTTGSLSVAADSNSSLLLEPLNVRNGQGQQGVVPPGKGIFIFNGLKPGRYRLAGALNGHHPSEMQVEIKANAGADATLVFEPILYSVTVKTNVGTGELRYATEGQPLSKIVSIQGGMAALSLPAGKYDIEISTDEFGYESARRSFTLTTDKTSLDLPLKRIALTTDTLAPKWTSAEIQAWEMPTGWGPDSKKNLVVKGSGVALPREEGLRYYKDFKLSSTAKMTNAVALSFALRVRDSQNYYLLQVTGEKSDEPYTARLFVVKNNVEQRLRGIPIPKAGAKAMAQDQFFTVSIKMVDFNITVEIEDSETGVPFPLGVLTDPAKNFAVGAVGIAGRNNEDNVIGRFVVCTGAKCLSD